MEIIFLKHKSMAKNTNNENKIAGFCLCSIVVHNLM